MADKRISQLIERTDIANNDVLPIVASGATTTNKVTISTIQDWMQDNLDVGVTSVGITLGTTGTDVNVSGSPITTSGNITINFPTASATNRGLLSSADWSTFNGKQNAITLTTTGSSGAATLVGSTLNIPNYSNALSDYVPYTGATQSVDLGVHQLNAGSARINGASPTGGSFLGFKHSTSVTTGTDGYTSMYTFGTNNIGFQSISGATQKDFSFSMVGITPGVPGGRTYNLPDASGTLALTSDLTGYVTLGTAQTITAQKTFSTSGSSDTAVINHGSGSGIALNITKAGNGEGLRVTKTSGSGNAVTITGGTLSAEAGQFSGDLQTSTRISATSGSNAITITPNVGGTQNRIETTGTLPLALVSAAAITLAAGGTTPQITLATTGAVTLTGALNGTSASFSGNVGIGTTASTSALTVNGQVNVVNLGVQGFYQARTSDTAGAGVFGGNSFVLRNGATSEDLCFDVFNRSTSVWYTPLRFTNSTGAATFASSVTTGGTIRMSNAVVNRAVIIGVDSASEPSIQAVVDNSDVPRQLSINPSGGNVGIGTASPSQRLTLNGNALLNASDSKLYFSQINNIDRSAIIQTELGGENNHSLLFFTNPSFGLPAERMRITSNGQVGINTSSFDFGEKLCLFSSTSYTLQSKRSGTGSEAHFAFSNANGAVGSIFTSGMATFFNATSDYRLKEDLQEVKGLEKVQAMKVYDYKWKADESRMDGVLAHELAEVLPYAVTGEKDDLDENGNDKMQSVDYSKIVPVLIKAIQEQQEIINEMRAEIDSLKNQIQ
jgi:hypothetical protein